MIYIFCALYHEAEPLIREYGLKKKTDETCFPVFFSEEENILLTVTGCGMNAATAAVARICTKRTPQPADFLVNIGTCAKVSYSKGSGQTCRNVSEKETAAGDGLHSSDKRKTVQEQSVKAGEVYLCKKIMEHVTGRTFYPDILYRHPFEQYVTERVVKNIARLLRLIGKHDRIRTAPPVTGLLERIDKGASSKFIIERQKSETDFFELDQKGDKVIIRGNDYVNIATGLNWYLKYYAGIHLSWNGNDVLKLPAVLPPVTKKERHETDLPYRYDLNYCTFSYSMAFWDWERWEKEIDWMALHGINLSLALTGTESVWRNVLLKLGYTKDEINEFVAGPGFTAWWLMNNLEGWGGPNPESWYTRQEKLQKKIVKRMREYGIEPVLPGYCGMVPHNAKEKLGLNVADPGFWCSYHRPAFLQPEDERFEEISALYYRELTKLYGKTGFYAIDPFHEGGSTQGVNLDAAGKAIMKAMKKTNPDAVWVAQAWQDNPRTPMIEHLEAGDLLVLDLHSECRPQWGDPASEWCRKGGYGQHEWVYCMLLNFGGNIGLHGKMDALIDGFYDAKADVHAGRTLRGVGMTPEGIENNPVMYELVMELPWREHRFTRDEWLKGYVYARYGVEDEALQQVWDLLGNGIYNSPKEKIQQGTHESGILRSSGVGCISGIQLVGDERIL